MLLLRSCTFSELSCASAQVRDLLRGEPGTTVDLLLQRDWLPEEIRLKVTESARACSYYFSWQVQLAGTGNILILAVNVLAVNSTAQANSVFLIPFRACTCVSGVLK